MEFGQLYTGGSATVVPVYSEPTEAQSVITGPNDHTGKDQSEAPRSKLRGIKNQSLIAVVGTLCSGG